MKVTTLVHCVCLRERERGRVEGTKSPHLPFIVGCPKTASSVFTSKKDFLQVISKKILLRNIHLWIIDSLIGIYFFSFSSFLNSCGIALYTLTS